VLVVLLCSSFKAFLDNNCFFLLSSMQEIKIDEDDKVKQRDSGPISMEQASAISDGLYYYEQVSASTNSTFLIRRYYSVATLTEGAAALIHINALPDRLKVYLTITSIPFDLYEFPFYMNA
jgi:hypothetical protein